MALAFRLTACACIGMAVIDFANGRSPIDSLQMAFLAVIAAKIWQKEDA